MNTGGIGSRQREEQLQDAEREGVEKVVCSGKAGDLLIAGDDSRRE